MDIDALQAAEQDGPPQDAVEEPVCWVLEENWPALRLFLACRPQLELTLGTGGGAWLPARSVNVGRELDWLTGIAPVDHGETVERYRVIEGELLRLMNQQLNERAD